VHRDLSPGNIIVVDGKAKISDLEFAKRRAARELEKLTRQTDQSLSVAKDTRTVSLHFDMFCESF
jgi:serine/threonine protein kinase